MNEGRKEWASLAGLLAKRDPEFMAALLEGAEAEAPCRDALAYTAEELAEAAEPLPVPLVRFLARAARGELPPLKAGRFAIDNAFRDLRLAGRVRDLKNESGSREAAIRRVAEAERMTPDAVKKAIRNVRWYRAGKE